MTLTAILPAAMTALLGEIARQALMASAARSRAYRAKGMTIYRVTLPGQLVFAAATLIMGSLTAIVLSHGEDWRIAAMLGAFVMLCVFGYPGAIVLDPAAGLRTRRWYGRPVQIAWHDVAELRRMDQVGQSVVVSCSGRQIIHSSLHADRPGFRREVEYYARLTPRIEPA